MTERLHTDTVPLRGPGDTRTWFTFSGTYEHDGKTHLWSVTSTNIVYEMRHKSHWAAGQATHDDKKTWVKITQDHYALVDKAYFSSPRVQEMKDGN